LIKKGYEVLFFLLYNHYKFGKDKFGKAYFVTFLITTFESLNISTIFMFLKILLHVYGETKFYSLIIFICVALINIYLFIYKNKFESIIVKYDILNTNWHHRFKLYLWLYYILSMLALAYSILLDSVNGEFQIIEHYFKNLGL
jgi:hypothetical protein